MNNIEMRGICHRCEFYKQISYVTGESSVGCTYGSKDGYPTDIRNMECCPVRKDGSGFQKIDLNEMLVVLNQLYVMCSASEAEFSLVDVVEMTAGPSIKGRRTFVSHAIRDLKVLKIIERNGRKYSYRWNMKKWGPPSLDVAQQVAAQVYVLTHRLVEEQRERRARQAEQAKGRPAKVMKEPTKCDTCKLRGQKGCRQMLLKMGIDCKIYDVNTLKIVDDEAGMGR